MARCPHRIATALQKVREGKGGPRGVPRRVEGVGRGWPSYVRESWRQKGMRLAEVWLGKFEKKGDKVGCCIDRGAGICTPRVVRGLWEASGQGCDGT